MVFKLTNEFDGEGDSPQLSAFSKVDGVVRLLGIFIEAVNPLFGVFANRGNFSSKRGWGQGFWGSFGEVDS